MVMLVGMMSKAPALDAKVSAYDSVMPSSRLRSPSWSSDNPYQAMFYMLCWYTFSTSATFINKTLIKEHGMSAELLTVCHLVMGTIFDAAIFAVPATSKYKMWFLQPMKLSSLLRLLPLSVLAIASKLLTYWSYSRVPVAVTHTCKASTPLFNVMLAFVVYRTSHATPIYVSLVPIVVGVAMASLSEVQINEVATAGLICAVASSMSGVMQSMYAKYLLRHGVIVDSVNLHFYSGLLCILVNSPVLMWNQAMLPDQYESAMFFIYSHEIRNVIFLPRIPYTLIFVCSICQFVSSLASILVMCLRSMWCCHVIHVCVVCMRSYWATWQNSRTRS
ncbi:hypothetical protein, variant 2 [Aphanomyces astaci]|uniref:Sugar phosphate transporter domain-containing protein n=1 Tax=Aphanomyces astaci TaxID=112090 RepID=W4FFB7_APHAT|nr:hypothetical protein, variant 2 [Aphanomyces astaci]ETV66202.1 hypothetical protein, variant 2 [Aphanomyces astaci]|eukprot:XP_009844391.1 hypothetical protein, variant 2 [Aphanomyces astaci]